MMRWLALVFTVGAVADWGNFVERGGDVWLFGGCVWTVAATAWLIRWRRDARRVRQATSGASVNGDG